MTAGITVTDQTFAEVTDVSGLGLAYSFASWAGLCGASGSHARAAPSWLHLLCCLAKASHQISFAPFCCSSLLPAACLACLAASVRLSGPLQAWPSRASLWTA